MCRLLHLNVVKRQAERLTVKSCFSMSLRDASLIHGWLGLVVAVIVIGFLISDIIIYSPKEKSFLLKSESSTIYTCLPLLVMDFISSCCLIAGIKKNQPTLLLPWLNIRYSVFILAVWFIGLVLYKQPINPLGTIGVVMGALASAFCSVYVAWSWIVVNSLNHEMSNTLNNQLPDIESGSTGQAPPPYQRFDND